MILEIDKDTLGVKGKNRGRPVSKTKIKVKCDVDGCANYWWTIWRYRKERDSDMCISHKNENGICGMLNKKHSEETIEIFKDGRRAGENNVSKREFVRQKISWTKRRKAYEKKMRESDSESDN